jgi:predicted dehydrogenase
MNQNPPRPPAPSPEHNRRNFLKGSSVATLMAMMGARELIAPVHAQETPPSTPSGMPLKIGVIGCGAWGREILNTLARLPSAEVVAVCDTYPAMLRRAKDPAPKAEAFTDYAKLLANGDIAGVIVATPTHQHAEIVEAALQAGKQVYCEAPVAHTIEEARRIALAAKNASTQYFQSGLSLRSDPQRRFLLDFIRAGAAGRPVKARSQWHKKQSLRRTSPNADREKELNWRLSAETSPGLIAEMAIHQLDNIVWYLNRRPTAVTGFGSTILWKDGRDVPDSAQATYEFSSGTLATCEVTLANSFDADFEMLYGSDAAVMLRGNKAWMFKEVDAPLLGWEVYAAKDTFYKETGIALVADATKLKRTETAEEVPYTNTPLFHALEAFAYNSDVVRVAVKDFIDNFGSEDKEALAEALKHAVSNNKPASDWREGYEATVLALKGTEAVRKKARLEIPEELFAI